MTNPWRDIPESDYVGHMSSPAVGQRAVLGHLLGEIVRKTSPEAILIIGASTGNGLEHVDPARTRRVTCVDINANYLATLAQRLEGAAFEIDTRPADIADCHFGRESFDLIHAALVFEYIAWPLLMPRVASWLKPGGALNIVLQRPSALTPAVTPTPFKSLLGLEAIFRFVEPQAVVAEAQRADLCLAHRRDVPLPGDKMFTVLQLERPRD